MNQLIAKFVAELKAQQDDIARNNCMQNRPAEFMHIEAGKYQGIQSALDALDNALRDHYEQEKRA